MAFYQSLDKTGIWHILLLSTPKPVSTEGTSAAALATSDLFRTLWLKVFGNNEPPFPKTTFWKLFVKKNLRTEPEIYLRGLLLGV